LKIRDVTEIHASGLTPAACEEIREVIQRHQGRLISMGNPTSTLEELFVRVVSESQAHPGRRVRGSEDRGAAESPLYVLDDPSKPAPPPNVP
jgi:ABC-2 type transport system ATP-binding protein